jgi:fluoride exporter
VRMVRRGADRAVEGRLGRQAIALRIHRVTAARARSESSNVRLSRPPSPTRGPSSSTSQAGAVRGTWTAERAVAVAVGGIAGAAVRWAALAALSAGTFPWPVLALNVAGSVLLGVLLAEPAAGPRARVVLQDAGAVGFCGGLTTFSTFALEVAELVRDHHAATAALYLLASVGGAAVGVMIGAAWRRRGRAATVAVEQRP